MHVPGEMSETVSFPLFDGGPFYRLQQAIGLVPGEQRRFGRGALYAVLVVWVPLVVLAAVQGLALGPTRPESFLMDFEANARFLVTVPALILGEAMCGPLLLSVVRQFLEAGLVKDASRARFEATVRDTVRLSHSGRAEAVMLGLAYLHSAIAFVFILDLPDSTWRLPVKEGHHVLTLAGGWYFLVAFPSYSFLLWRWSWRLGLWWRLLWRTSRLDLRLSPAHRDGAGGLAFLSESLPAFAGFVFAVTATGAGSVADLVGYEGYPLLQYEWEVGGLVALLLILIAGPLVLFMSPLYEAKERALFRYGALATRQIQHVEGKWLPEGTVSGDFEASMPDFRSVTHLGHSVAAVHKMSLIPLKKEDILQLVIIALLPFVPVLLTQIPMGEMVAILLKVLA